LPRSRLLDYESETFKEDDGDEKGEREGKKLPGPPLITMTT
jgi:hypothetical protein